MFSLLVALTLPAAAHDATPCEAARSTRGYAVAAGLDTRTLDLLERRLCGADPAHLSGASAVCQEARVLQRVGALGGLNSDATAGLGRLADVSCAGSGDDPGGQPIQWANGVTARHIDGTWSWPNGVTARTAAGGLAYPNAVTAKTPEGRWSYPNAVTARAADGAFSRPNGVEVGGAEALLMWVCEQVEDGCRAAISPLQHLDGDAHTAAMLQLAWDAR